MCRAQIGLINNGKACYNCYVATPCTDPNVKVSVLSANQGASKNAWSAVVRVDFYGGSYLLPGDFEVSSVMNNAITALGSKLNVNVYQVSHHGASTVANSQSWLNAVNAQLNVISATRVDRRYKHPRCQTMHRIKSIPNNRIVTNLPEHLVQCGAPTTSETLKLGIYQTTLMDTNGNTFGQFIDVTTTPKGVNTVAVVPAPVQFHAMVAELEKAAMSTAMFEFLPATISPETAPTVSAAGGRKCQNCEVTMGAVSDNTVEISIDSEELGFLDSFGQQVAVAELVGQEAHLIADVPNDHAWPWQCGKELINLASIEIRRVCDASGQDCGDTRVVAKGPQGIEVTFDISDNSIDEASAFTCSVVQTVHEPTFSYKVALSSSCCTAQTLADQPFTLAAAAPGGDSAVGVFKLLLPMLNNLSPANYSDNTVTLSNAGIAFNVSGLYNASLATFLRFNYSDTLVNSSVGPFHVAVSDAHVDVFLNPAGSKQRLNFTGGVTLHVDFPFLGSKLDLTTRLSFPITTTAPLELNLSLAASNATFGFGLDGSFQYYGLFNPNNMGFLLLEVPGLGDFSTSTANTPVPVRAGTIPVLLPDYFSGLSFNRTTSSFTFRGYGGTAAAATGGHALLDQPVFCFSRLADDIVASMNKTTAGQLRLDAGPRAFYTYADGLPRTSAQCSNDTQSVFPNIQLPQVTDKYAALGGMACLTGLFGGAGDPPMVPSTGTIASLASGLPIRLVLPTDLLKNTTAMLSGLLPESVHLSNVTVDIRRFRTEGADTSTYEGVVAASVTLDGVNMTLFAALSTAPPGNTSACRLVTRAVGTGTPESTMTEASSGFGASALRLYSLHVQYSSSFVDLRGTLYGLTGTCPGRLLAADLDLVLQLGAVDAGRASIRAQGYFDLCNNTQASPRWIIHSDVVLSNVSVFGSELNLLNATVSAMGYAATNNNATTWEVALAGDAYDFLGFDQLSVVVNARNTGVAAAMLAVNTTLLGDDHLRVAGSIKYNRDQSAKGNVTLDFNSSFGSFHAKGFFEKNVIGSPHRWTFGASAANLSLGVLSVPSATVVIGAVPRGKYNASNATSDAVPPTMDLLGSMAVVNATLAGSSMFQASGNVSWNGTSSANVSLTFVHSSDYLVMSGNLDMVLPATGPNGRAQGGVDLTIKGNAGGQFHGAITWCNNVTCGDAAYDPDGQALFQVHDSFIGLQCGGEYDTATLMAMAPRKCGGRELSRIDHFAALARMGVPAQRARTAVEFDDAAPLPDTAVIIEANASEWQIDAFTLRALALVVRCEGSCCVGSALGEATIGDHLDVTAATIFNSVQGVQTVNFTAIEHSTFITLSAELQYQSKPGSASASDYELLGSGTVNFAVPVHNGVPVQGNEPNSSLAATNANFNLTQSGGQMSFRVWGQTSLFAYDFVREVRDQKVCWSGKFTVGKIDVLVDCNTIEVEAHIELQIPTPYVDVAVNATLYGTSNATLPGCEYSLGGNGSVSLDFSRNTALDIPRVQFQLSAVGCNVSFRGVLELDTGNSVQDFLVIPLGFTSLKVGHVGAAVSYIRNATDATNGALEVALVGTVGGSSSDDSLLDVILLFNDTSWQLAGMLKGPTDFTGLVSVLAPGVSTTVLANDMKMTVNAALVVLSGSKVRVGMNMNIFGVNCTAQLVVETAPSGGAQVTLYVDVENSAAKPPPPLDQLSSLLPEIKFVFLLTTGSLQKGSTLNPSQEVTDFVTALSDLPGQGYTKELLERALSVSEQVGTTQLPDVGDAGFGPGVLVQAFIGSDNTGVRSLSESVRSITALKDSIPTTPQLSLLAAFQWSKDELDLVLKLEFSEQIAPDQTHFSLDALFLSVTLVPTLPNPKFGFGMTFLLVTKSGQNFTFTGALYVDEVELAGELEAYSDHPWVNPLGISQNVQVLFPVGVGMGINIESGVPDSFKFDAGLTILGQSAEVSLALTVKGSEAFCASVEHFDLHKLVAAALCSDGGDCLGPTLDLLSSVSLDEGVVKYNTFPSVTTKHSGPCQTIPSGYFFQLQNLSLFDTLNVQEMCLAIPLSTQSELGPSPEIAAVVQMNRTDLGPFTLKKSTNPQCPTVTLPPDSPCNTQSVNNTGPTLKLLAAPSKKQLLFSFDSNLNILGVDLDTCLYVDTTKFYADVVLNLSSAISFNATISASYTKVPPNLDFFLSASLETKNNTGVVKLLYDAVQRELDEFNAKLESAATTAKRGLQSAQRKVNDAKSALRRAQQKVDSAFASLLNSVHSKENKVNGLQSSCQHHKHKCGFWHPIECASFLVCEAEYGVALAALKLAELALKAAKAVPDAALKVANGALSAANLVLEGAKVTVDAAVGAVEALEQVILLAIKVAGTIFDLKSLGFSAHITKDQLSGTFHMVGVVFGKDFDVNFGGTLSIDHLVTAAIDSLKTIFSSVFGSIGDGSKTTEVIGMMEVIGNQTNSSSSQQFFLPHSAQQKQLATAQSTDVFTTPFNVRAPGAMDNLCDGILQSMTNTSHGVVLVDLQLPGNCTIKGKNGACLDMVLAECIIPGHAGMVALKQTYTHLTQSLVRSEVVVGEMHKMRMSPSMQRCHSLRCRVLAHEVAVSGWTVTISARQSGASGPLPASLDMDHGMNMMYIIDLSGNQFVGAIPATYGANLHGLYLQNNWLTAGLAVLGKKAINLRSLDLSGNSALAYNATCSPVDALQAMTRLDTFSFGGDDLLVPADPVQCVKQRQPLSQVGVQGVFKMNLTAWTDLCSNCNVDLPAFGCFDDPCVDTGLLSLLQGNVTAVVNGLLANANVHVTLSSAQVSIEAVDISVDNQTAVTVATALALTPAQAAQAVKYRSSSVVVTEVACPPGRVGRECAVDCLYGWDRVNVAPLTDFSTVIATKLRLPQCHPPALSATCTNFTLVQALQNVTGSCPTSNMSTAPVECEHAFGMVAPFVPASVNTSRPAWYCQLVHNVSELTPCMRAVVPFYANLVCPAAVVAATPAATPFLTSCPEPAATPLHGTTHGFGDSMPTSRPPCEPLTKYVAFLLRTNLISPAVAAKTVTRLMARDAELTDFLHNMCMAYDGELLAAAYLN